MWGRGKKCRSFTTCLNMNDYQFKASRYSYGSTYLNSTVTTNQKYTTDSQKPKRKKCKYITKKNHQTIKGKTKRINKENYKINLKTRNKMAINTYLPIITLNVHGINALIKTHGVAELIKNK